jgi:hypothetical protein
MTVRTQCGWCGRLAKVQRRVDGQSMCGTCERRWLNSTARCKRCGESRRPAIGTAHTGLCEPCAGIVSTQICGRCGVEQDLYASARCTDCYLVEEIDRMRRVGDPAAVATLSRYLTALETARPANTVLHWLRISRASAAPVLREMLAGGRPITHAALDELPDSYAIEFLRAALVRHGALPDRDEVLHRFERWIITTTEILPDHPDRAHVRRWATWVILRDLRARRHAVATASDRGARSSVRVARGFVAAMHDQQLTLATTRQEHVDRWFANGATTCRLIRPFLRWTSKTGVTPQLETHTRVEQYQGMQLADQERLALIARLLNDDTLELRIRVAGLLVLLYGQPLSRVSRIRIESIHQRGREISIKLVRDELTIPEPIDELVGQLARAPQRRTLHDTGAGWLFPGAIAGAPITEERLRRRLVKQLGPLPVRHGRNSAVTHLLRATPAPILADLLGFSQQRADRWARLAGTEYANYIAARHVAETRPDAVTVQDAEYDPFGVVSDPRS